LLIETYNNSIAALTGGNHISNPLHRLNSIPRYTDSKLQSCSYKGLNVANWNLWGLLCIRHGSVMIYVNLRLWKIFPSSNLIRAKPLKHFWRSLSQEA